MEKALIYVILKFTKGRYIVHKMYDGEKPLLLNINKKVHCLFYSVGNGSIIAYVKEIQGLQYKYRGAWT